jgi:protocatechuate 3,4-dioxygenase beta subunit
MFLLFALFGLAFSPVCLPQLWQASLGSTGTPDDGGSPGLAVIADSFEGEALDTSKWMVTDGEPKQSRGVLRLTSSSGNLQRLHTARKLSADGGDVWAEVSYSNFSANSGGGELGLRMYSGSRTGNFTAWINVATWAGNDPFRCDFILDHPDGSRTVWLKKETRSTSGRFRLIYRKSTRLIEGFYNEGDGWQTLGDTSADPMPLDISKGIQFDLRAWCGTAEGQSIDFDDFYARGYPFTGTASEMTAVSPTDAKEPTGDGGQGDALVAIHVDALPTVPLDSRLPADPGKGPVAASEILPAASDECEGKSGYILTGHVRDEAGLPIEGAVFTWGVDYKPLEEYEKTMTDPGGYYRLCPELVHPQCQLAVSAKGYAPVWKRDLVFQPKGTPTVLNLTLKPGHRVKGHVFDVAGNPISGVTVEAWEAQRKMFRSSFFITPDPRPLPGEGTRRTTDAEGRFELTDLPGPEVQLRFWGGEQWDDHRGNYSVDQEVVVVLAKRSEDSRSGWDQVVRGRVFDAEAGLPIESFTVTIYGKTRSFQDEEGRFTFPGLFGYRYRRVLVEAKGYQPTVARSIEADPEGQAEEHQILLKKGKGLEGILVDALTGEGIPGVSIIYGIADEARYFAWGDCENYKHNSGPLRGTVRHTTHEDATFMFPEAADEKGTLFIRQPGYARRILFPENRVYDTDSGLLRVELQPEGSISGIVFRDGEPEPNAGITLGLHQQSRKPEQEFETVRADDEGRFRIGSLAPGSYRVSVRDSAEAYGNIRLSLRFELERGEHKVLNVGDDLGPFAWRGRVEPWTYIRLKPMFDWEYTALCTRSGPDGGFEIRGLREGKYDVWYSKTYSSGGHRSDDAEIVISATSAVDLSRE